MKRLPYFVLTLGLAAAVAAVFAPCGSGPGESCTEPTIVTVVQPPPESAVLRTLARRRIARDAAAGRRSLVEAAALFHVLNLSGDVPARFPDDHPWALASSCHTDEERLCRQVVQWVDTLQRLEPRDSDAAAVARLNAEFQEELRRHGAIRLPDLTGSPTAGELLETFRATMTDTERRTLYGPGTRTGKR